MNTRVPADERRVAHGGIEIDQDADMLQVVTG